MKKFNVFIRGAPFDIQGRAWKLFFFFKKKKEKESLNLRQAEKKQIFASYFYLIAIVGYLVVPPSAHKGIPTKKYTGVQLWGVKFTLIVKYRKEQPSLKS